PWGAPGRQSDLRPSRRDFSIAIIQPAARIAAAARGASGVVRGKPREPIHGEGPARMIETLSPKKELEDLQADLREGQELLRRHRLVEHLVERQEMPKRELVESLVHRQNVAQLRAKLDTMHPADIAYVLESLPLEERLVVWNLVKAERDGEILLQASDAVRETIIRSMDLQELVAAAGQLADDAEDELAQDLPAGCI